MKARAFTTTRNAYSGLAYKIHMQPVKANDLVQVIDTTGQIDRTSLKTIESIAQAEQTQATKLIGSDQFETGAAPFNVGEDGIF